LEFKWWRQNLTSAAAAAVSRCTGRKRAERSLPHSGRTAASGQRPPSVREGLTTDSAQPDQALRMRSAFHPSSERRLTLSSPRRFRTLQHALCCAQGPPTLGGCAEHGGGGCTQAGTLRNPPATLLAHNPTPGATEEVVAVRTQSHPRSRRSSNREALPL
jgi:hypothetical protein